MLKNVKIKSIFLGLCPAPPQTFMQISWIVFSMWIFVFCSIEAPIWILVKIDLFLTTVGYE